MTFGALYMCGSVCVWRARPSAWILMFWFSGDVLGWEVGVFPPANESARLRLGAQPLDAVQIGESYGC